MHVVERVYCSGELRKADFLVAKILNIEQQPFTLSCRGYLFSVIDPQPYVLKQLFSLVSR